MGFDIHEKGYKSWIKPIAASLCLTGILVIIALMCRVILFPYKQQGVYTLSQNWEYCTEQDPTLHPLPEGRFIPNAKTGEHLFMSRILTENLPGGTLLVKGDLQYIRFLLDDQEFYTIPNQFTANKPGYIMEFVPLPPGYIGKTLTIEFWSPYHNYAGTIPNIHIGNITSLEVFTLTQSMLQFTILFICGSGGLLFITIGVIAAFSHIPKWDMFFLGIFSVVWGMYCFVGGYISLQFLSPIAASNIRFILHLTYHIPLLWYLYHLFIRYKKALFPAILLSILCAIVALTLAALGMVDLINCFVIISPIYQFFFLYAVALIVAEYRHKNPMFQKLLPWAVPALIIWAMLFLDFYIDFIPTHTLTTLYHISLFWIIMLLWFHTLLQQYHMSVQKNKEINILEIKNKLTQDSYTFALNHVEQMGIIRHEMNNQLTTLSYLMQRGEFEKVEQYLGSITKDNKLAEQAVYCNNYLVNSILVSKLSSLPVKNIQVKVQVNIPPQLAIGENDLCSLLVNVLDNAIEACLSIPPGYTRWIKINLQMRSPYLFFQCSNAKHGTTSEKTIVFLAIKKITSSMATV